MWVVSRALSMPFRVFDGAFPASGVHERKTAALFYCVERYALSFAARYNLGDI